MHFLKLKYVYVARRAMCHAQIQKTVQCFGVAGSHRHPYFSGGYITQVHGRDDFDAIQVETPRDLRIERGEEGRERFGHALGRAICDFYNFHYVNNNKKSDWWSLLFWIYEFVNNDPNEKIKWWIIYKKKAMKRAYWKIQFLGA